MIIHLEPNIQPGQLAEVQQKLTAHGFTSTEVRTQSHHYLVGVGKKPIDIRVIGTLPGIQDIHRVSDGYKLVSKKWRVQDTKIDLGDGVGIGTGHFQIMAGPCSIESEEQVEAVVKHLVANDVKIMRGGVYKPRSSPYSFRGLGQEGLQMFHQICREHGIRIITEVMMVEQIAEMHDFIDIYQVGARNAQNFNLLDALGEVDKPVLLKRGMSGTIEELLQGAEYIFSHGNEKIMLCERGIRTYENAYRNTMDINAIAMLKKMTHLPVIADPSHGIGIRAFVEPIALASVMAGADGIIMEVHQTPEKAASDGQQTLNFVEATEAYRRLRATRKLWEEF
ncbi:MAG TPA: 3-deoxy-7-phosphoheptulonate synthase [Saprospiraceae bacterium]|nr:3-deoxy-7-phosphoheptulonate synthase [Saprospiraceae bacterium]